MAWNWLTRWFRQGGDAKGTSRDVQKLPQVNWLDSANNPWPVPVLDVRPVTLSLLSMSQDPQCAANSISFRQDDGLSFIAVEPTIPRLVPADLRFRIDGTLTDGALFIPVEMEHKWALYFHQEKIICLRSWRRQVVAVADTRIVGEFLEIHRIRGVCCSDDEAPDFTVRVVDFLIRSHVLKIVYPAPLPTDLSTEPSQAALWCMAHFGNLAHFATPHVIAPVPPEQPIRTDSLLHIAVARGDLGAIQNCLEKGNPIEALSQDGLAPLHWAISRDGTDVLSLLLDQGSPVDVRSAEGATPLMNAAQARSVQKVAYLLEHGANPNAVDQRGFTALHRAAEMGEREIVRLLLNRGSAPHPEAEGHTPRSLAAGRGETAIVEMFDGASHAR